MRNVPEKPDFSGTFRVGARGRAGSERSDALDLSARINRDGLQAAGFDRPAAVLGAGLGCLLAIVIEFTDKSIYTVEQLKELLPSDDPSLAGSL